MAIANTASWFSNWKVTKKEKEKNTYCTLKRRFGLKRQDSEFPDNADQGLQC